MVKKIEPEYLELDKCSWSYRIWSEWYIISYEIPGLVLVCKRNRILISGIDITEKCERMFSGGISVCFKSVSDKYYQKNSLFYKLYLEFVQRPSIIPLPF